MKKRTIEETYVNISEAARYVGVSWNKMNAWINDGIIKARVLPNNTSKRMIRIRLSDLDTFICQGKKAA